MRLGYKNKTSFILYCNRISLSLDKIGCGSAIKIKQVLFCIAIAFRYLCIVNYYFAQKGKKGTKGEHSDEIPDRNTELRPNN